MRRTIINVIAGATLAVLAGCGEAPEQASEEASELGRKEMSVTVENNTPAASPESARSASKAFHHLSVGVGDLDEALALWRDRFGFEVVSQSTGPDAQLSRAWGLAPDAIAAQALLRGTSFEDRGMLHLIQYTDPLPPVREGAAVSDSLPKNIDFYTNRIHDQMAALQAEGWSFRSDEPNDIGAGRKVWETQMRGHDETNIVMVEIEDEEFPYNGQGNYGLTMFVAIVDDIKMERDFYTGLLGLNLNSTSNLGGPGLEAATGLPKGTRWLIDILGEKDRSEGQVELVQYQGAEGVNRYDRAVPGARGLTAVSYRVADLAPMLDFLDAQKNGYSRHNAVGVAGGCYDAVNTRSPAGMLIQMLAESLNCVD